MQDVGLIGRVLLGVLTLSVAVASVVVLSTYPKAPPTSAASPQPYSSSDTVSESAVSPARLRVAVVGPDLAELSERLGVVSGAEVMVAQHAAPDVLAPGALAAVSSPPDVVILQVVAGSSTTSRTQTAVTAVQTKWPAARVLLVGPFSSADRKSAQAVAVAARTARVTFLDPVALGWRANASTPLDEDDHPGIVSGLADVLAA